MEFEEYKKELIITALEKDPSLKSEDEAVMFTSGVKALLSHFNAHKLYNEKKFLEASELSFLAKKETGIEIVEEAVKGARENAEDNNLKNIKFYQGDVFQVLKKEKIQADVIVVDPPREGIGKEAVEKISEFQTDQILYISCNPLTLVKDLEDFTNFGYKIKELRALDQFPRTFHVETVTLLSKLNTEHHLDI